MFSSEILLLSMISRNFLSPVLLMKITPDLAKRLLKTNMRLANRGLTSLVKEAAGS